jgi:hypothetical protein
VGPTSASSASGIDPRQARRHLRGRGALWRARSGTAHRGHARHGARFPPLRFMSGVPISGVGKGMALEERVDELGSGPSRLGSGLSFFYF